MTLKFLVVRAVSDSADEDGSETFESNMQSVSLHALCLVEELIKHYRKGDH